MDSNRALNDEAIADEPPVTQWLRRLEHGDRAAAEPLWDHFCRKLIDMARSRISKRIRSAYDEEDVAVSAFHSLCRGIQSQKFELRDRNDLWRLLATISERKLLRRYRSETADRRDVRRNADIVFQDDSGFSSQSVAMEIEGHEPSPAYAAEVADTCDSLLALLPDDKLREVAMHKLDNRTDDEIADLLQCTRRTVQRKLSLIREIWLSASQED